MAARSGVRPFRIAVPQEQLDDLRSRLAVTRWPPAELEPAWREGVPVDWLRSLAEHWRDRYDWRRLEQWVNAHEQFLVEVDGVDVHALRIRSPHPDAVPVVLTHGWPGTVLEYLDVAARLADPRLDDADPAVSADVVLPSLPGYGFSGRPTEAGWGVDRIADAWVELMDRLGYRSFLAGGSDWGTSVSAAIGTRHPDRVVALHLVPPLVAPDPAVTATPAERAAARALADRERDGSAYGLIHADRPQTLGYGLTDSPVALAGWIAEKYWAWVDHDGDLFDVVPRDTLLDTITLYWLTGSAASSIRLYRESIADVTAIFTAADPVPVRVPVGATMFPREVPWVSRRWAERRFPDLRVWDEPARGGHFGGLEQPAALVDGIRATLRSVR